MVQNNRQQKTNFGTLPIDEITRTDRTAELFRTQVTKYPATPEHFEQLEAAIIKARGESEFGIASFLGDALRKLKEKTTQ